uniref:Immunoglobulin I-set domain-containing protein n=1 Tax=Acanthochromis polyacanthus TaxID=80966 RepID=A0A3Q1F5A3_9TELE
MTVRWTKPGLHPEYIHVHQDGRMRVFVDELLHGNVSLKIFSVKRSDEGKYRVFVPSIRQEAFMFPSSYVWLLELC